MKYRPEGDRIVLTDVSDSDINIKPSEFEFAGERNKQTSVKKILATGPGTPISPMTSKPGDVVVIQKHVGIPFQFEGESVIIVRVTDIELTLIPT